MTSDLMIAIHQPNFLPWMGYFNKIYRSNKFIFLDDALVQKKGGSWSNRVRILIGGRPQWITVPITRTTGSQRLNETRISSDGWRTEMFATIQMAYSRSSHYKETMTLIEKIFSDETQILSHWNVNSIQLILSYLGLSTPEMVLSSDLKVTTTGSERLRDLIAAVGGSSYLCGGGSGGYLDESVLLDARIDICHQDYDSRSYPQLNRSEFEPGLSIIDALMMLGPDETASLIVNVSR